MEEIWKDVKGYEGLYQVSNLGNVKGRCVKYLKPGIVNGYKYVVFSVNGKRKNYSVHRLVAEAFCEKKEGKDQVNHIDENRFNNKATNLEWVSCVENIRHGTGIQRRALSQLNDKRSHKVIQIDLDGNVINEYPSIRQITRDKGYDRAFVTRCLKGKCLTAYGYKWQYAGEITSGENAL